jgi:hypothetical protein
MADLPFHGGSYAMTLGGRLEKIQPRRLPRRRQEDRSRGQEDVKVVCSQERQKNETGRAKGGRQDDAELIAAV